LAVVTLPDLVYDPENPNVAFVSFYAPGFDPLLETDVLMELANATTALTETQTNISTSIDHTTGQVGQKKSLDVNPEFQILWGITVAFSRCQLVPKP
jgi:hypothetical protein